MALVMKRVRLGWSSDTYLALDAMALERGDKVAVVETAYTGNVVYMLVVQRTTATQIVMEGRNTRYRREDGGVHGQRHTNGKLLHPLDPEVVAAQHGMLMRALAKEVAERTVSRGKSAADYIKACREIELKSRQVAERIELMERQSQEWAAEWEGVLS